MWFAFRNHKIKITSISSGVLPFASIFICPALFLILPFTSSFIFISKPFVLAEFRRNPEIAPKALHYGIIQLCFVIYRDPVVLHQPRNLPSH